VTSHAKRDLDVRRACIAAIISGGVTLAVFVFALMTKDGLGLFSGFGFIDAAVIFVLVYWVRRNSRIAISLLILHLIFSKLDLFWRTGKLVALIGLCVFGYFYAAGAIAIFEHYKERTSDA
jgi:hypothetical protein